MINGELATIEEVRSDWAGGEPLYVLKINGGYGKIFAKERSLTEISWHLPKCECGSDSIRGWLNSNAHTSWCPKYKGKN